MLPGPTGRGKSALAIQIASHVSTSTPVVVISTELRARQLVARVVAPILGRPWLEPGGACTWNVTRSQRPLPGVAWSSSTARSVETWPQGRSPIASPSEWGSARCSSSTICKTSPAGADRRSTIRRLAVAAMSDEIRQWALDTGGTAVIVSSAARTWGDSNGGDRQIRDYAHSAKESGDVDADAAAIIAVDIEPCPAGGVTSATLRVAKSRYHTPGEVRLEYLGALGLFRVPAGPVLTPLEREVIAAIRKGANSRNAIAKATGGKRATVLGAVSALVGRGVLTAGLELAEETL